MVLLDFRLHLSSRRGAEWSALGVSPWFPWHVQSKRSRNTKRLQARGIHHRRPEKLTSHLNDTFGWITGNLFGVFFSLFRMQREERVQRDKKLQISARQAIPCCSVGLWSDLQSPCHSSEGTLTSRSEHQRGRHLVAQTFKKTKTKKPKRVISRFKASRLHAGFPLCGFWANTTPLNSRQTDKEYICFSRRNVTGHSCYNCNYISCHHRHGRETHWNATYCSAGGWRRRNGWGRRSTPVVSTAGWRVRRVFNAKVQQTSQELVYLLLASTLEETPQQLVVLSAFICCGHTVCG